MESPESSALRERDVARRNVEDLERDLAAYPEERDAILLEMAGQWVAAGDDDRALQICDDVIATAADQEDAQLAVVEKIDILDRLGRHDEVRAEIARLTQTRVHPGPAELLAEFFEAQGRLDEALSWYNVACRDFLMGDEDVPEFSLAQSRLNGRARVRKALGLPPDELDRHAADAHSATARMLDRLAQFEASSPSTGLGTFFVRSDVKRAFAEGLVHVDDPEDDDMTSYFHRVERGWRATARESGGTALTILPTTVDDLLRYGEEHERDPRDRQTRMDYTRDRVGAGAPTLHWPPERNQPCWCGSRRKYKKCCGSPANR